MLLSILFFMFTWLIVHLLLNLALFKLKGNRPDNQKCENWERVI